MKYYGWRQLFDDALNLRIISLFFPTFSFPLPFSSFSPSPRLFFLRSRHPLFDFRFFCFSLLFLSTLVITVFSLSSTLSPPSFIPFPPPPHLFPTCFSLPHTRFPFISFSTRLPPTLLSSFTLPSIFHLLLIHPSSTCTCPLIRSSSFLPPISLPPVFHLPFSPHPLFLLSSTYFCSTRLPPASLSSSSLPPFFHYLSSPRLPSTLLSSSLLPSFIHLPPPTPSFSQ